MSEMFRSVLTGPVGESDPDFLHDIGEDRLVGAIVALAAELFVLKDRQTKLETFLGQRGIDAAAGIEALTPADPAAIQRDADAFAGRILSELVRSRTPDSKIGRR